MAQHDHRSGSRLAVFFRQKGASHGGMHAQNVKVVAGSQLGKIQIGLPVDGHAHRRENEDAHSGKRLRAALDVFGVGERDRK